MRDWKAERPTRLANLLKSDQRPASEDGSSGSQSPAASPGYYSASDQPSAAASPYRMSPWNAAASPFIKSPWTHSSAVVAPLPFSSSDSSPGLVASLVREEGHVYSLAAAGGLLYTGSDGKNIRVWKNGSEFSGFKSGSGLVKAIVISGDKIFTGHQDGKIRVWRTSPKDPAVHKRVGSLPRLKDFLRSSINPNNYVEVRRHRNTVWIRHFDAVSCLSLDADQGLLYSGSWDKTLKVWRVSDSKCLESVNAHDDAINAVAAGFEGLVFSGSADGTVKVWRREGNRHVAVKTLLRQESAVTAIAVAAEAGVVYCGSSDGLVNVWGRGRRLAHGGVLRGHRLAVLCLAVAGSLLISGSADRTICVWRRDGGDHRKISVLKGHVGPVKCLAVEEDREADGRWILYSGSLDKSVKVWRVSERASEGDGAIVGKTPQHVWGSRSPCVQELAGPGGRVRPWN